MADRAIKDIGDKKECEEQFAEEEGGAKAEHEQDKGAEAGAGVPINFPEAWVRYVAYHEQGNGQHEGGNEHCERS